MLQDKWFLPRDIPSFLIAEQVLSSYPPGPITIDSPDAGHRGMDLPDLLRQHGQTHCKGAWLLVINREMTLHTEPKTFVF